jgi:hypothetical protein
VEELVSNRSSRTVLILVFAVIFAILAGCRTGPELNDEAQQTPRRARIAEMPAPEELGDNPCGNPNWATLPPEVGQLGEESHADDEPEDDE